MGRANREIVAAAFRVAELAADSTDTTSAVAAHRGRQAEHQATLAALADQLPSPDARIATHPARTARDGALVISSRAGSPMILLSCAPNPPRCDPTHTPET